MSAWPKDVPKWANARLQIVGPGIDENQQLKTAYSFASLVITGTLSGLVLMRNGVTLDTVAAPSGTYFLGTVSGLTSGGDDSFSAAGL